MGCCQSATVDPQLQKVNQQIDRAMDNAGKVDRSEKKLLLLGTGGSGKSTIFKNLRSVHGEDIRDERTISETANTVRANLVSGMFTLLAKSQYLYDLDPVKNEGCQVTTDDEKVVNCIRNVVVHAEETFGDEPGISTQEMEALGVAMDTLWKLPSVQETYAKRGGVFNFPDNMDYFYDKVIEVMDPNFEPTQQDIIKARVRTTGVVQFVYEKGDTIFNITDVGGQRNERKKWIHQFENVAAVIFVAALNHYNAVLFEDEKKNAMHEAVELFQQIANSKWFRKSELILFLNKDDLFVEDLRKGAALDVCFTTEKGWLEEQWTGPNYSPQETEEQDMEHFNECYGAAVKFIQDVFVKRNEVSTRVVFCHVTCACDQTNVEKVFWDVQNIVIRSNLKRGGLMV